MLKPSPFGVEYSIATKLILCNCNCFSYAIEGGFQHTKVSLHLWIPYSKVISNGLKKVVMVNDSKPSGSICTYYYARFKRVWFFGGEGRGGMGFSMLSWLARNLQGSRTHHSVERGSEAEQCKLYVSGMWRSSWWFGAGRVSFTGHRNSIHRE